MKRLNILWIGLISVLMTACYDDYEKDYDKSSVYFASQKPLRTLVADTDMSIKVGVAIGGKREVHTDDWATFEIDPSLLEGTGLTLMPENYYQLANPNKMTISNPNLAIADVKVTSPMLSIMTMPLWISIMPSLSGWSIIIRMK